MSTPSYLEPLADGLMMRPSGVWAKKKLDVLARYIRTSTIATNVKDQYWRRRIYIDLQAGPGKNCVTDSTGNCPEVNPDIFLGSPLLALTEGKGYTDYFLVEQDEQAFTALRQRCEAAPMRENVQVFAGDCNGVVNRITSYIHENIDVPPFSKINWNALCLAFLDPEGLELNWETVQRIASLRRADLVINFSIGGLRRSARAALELPAGETQVDRFYGNTSWREIPLHPDGSMPAREWIELYRERLKTLGYVSWGKDIPVKNRRNVELYRLLFASKDERGLAVKLWEDARKNAPTQRALF